MTLLLIPRAVSSEPDSPSSASAQAVGSLPADLPGLSQHLVGTFNSSFFYIEPYFSNESCAEFRSWEELRGRGDFFTGGLGSRMVLNVTEVWGCFEHHPCLEAVKRAVMVRQKSLVSPRKEPSIHHQKSSRSRLKETYSC